MALVMKDSGIVWIGEIPNDWDVVKSKYIIKANDGGIWGNEPVDSGKMKYVLRSTEQTVDGKWEIKNPALRDLSGTKYTHYLIRPGDLLITKSSGSKLHIGKTTLADDRFFDCEFYYSNFIQRVRVKDSVLPKFFWYLMNSDVVRQQFVFLQNSTSGIGNINATDIENLFIPLPSLHTQATIVNSLDKKCAEIDNVKNATKSTIEEYKKYKKVIISEIITKGLVPDVEFKDSGVEWVGVIPKHWCVANGKNILTLMDRPVWASDDVITCFRDGEVTLRKNRREEGFTFALKEIGYQGIEPGDLVIHGMDGFAGAIGISDSRGKGSPVLNVCDSSQNKRFLMYYLRSMAYNNVFTALATGVRVRSCDLKWNKLAELPYPFPPSIKEQEEIVDYLDTKCAEIDKLIATKEALVEDLKAYKKSLIYEYVTGKKEVI